MSSIYKDQFTPWYKRDWQEGKPAFKGGDQPSWKEANCFIRKMVRNAKLYQVKKGLGW